jgi:hypothetical protein
MPSNSFLTVAEIEILAPLWDRWENAIDYNSADCLKAKSDYLDLVESHYIRLKHKIPVGLENPEKCFRSMIRYECRTYIAKN